MALRVTYTGGDAPQRWLFDADEVGVLEAEKIEDALGPGETWDDFLIGLASPSVRLRRVLLWHLLRRTNPDYDLRFADAPEFKMGQLIVELGTAELDRLIAQYRDAVLPENRKQALLENLQQQRAEAALAEAELGEVTTDPKEHATPVVSAASAGTPFVEGLPAPTTAVGAYDPSETSTSPILPMS